MFHRPRCRDWTPLATQQLRLRNLIQISGHNIQCEPKSLIYYTLHLTSMSAPFFTSEKLETPTNANWSEINCQSIIKSTAKCVCVRIWQRHRSISEHNTKDLVKDDELNKVGHPQQFSDKILFLWGVYFSGLVPITKRTDVKLAPNSIVFYMHGGFFTSANCLLPQSLLRQYDAIMGVDEMKSVSNQSTPGSVSPSIDGLSGLKNSCDQLVVTVNQSNVNDLWPGGEIQDFPIQKNGLNYRSDPNLFLKRSNAEWSDLKFQSKNVRHQHNLHQPQQIESNQLKVRFIEKSFYSREIRPSYNVQKLLQLQEIQRTIKRKRENATELMEKICMKSAFCLNLELIANKAMFYRPRGNPSMGRTLNRLLFQQPEPPSPEIVLKAQELRRRIETARFRCRLLAQERIRSKSTIRSLEEKLNQLNDLNIEQETWLMANYHGLSRDRKLIEECYMSYRGQRILLDKILRQLQYRRLQLISELNDIFVIELTDRNTINGIRLPNAESYMDNFSSPASINVALGYVAHTVLMCSVLLNVPLRNPIIYKSSISRIRDNIKLIPEQDREFPLYYRSNPPPDQFLYAVFLLNQNIAQLKFIFNLSKGDLRATLSNLKQLLSIPIDYKAIGNANRITEVSGKNGDITDGSIMQAGDMDTPTTSISSSADHVHDVPIPNYIAENRYVSRSADSCTSVDRYRQNALRAVASTTYKHTIQNGSKTFSSEPILTKRSHNINENGSI